MPAYKKQHYLPTSYLKYFSDDQAVCNRTSFVWRFDGNRIHRVPVESQGFGDYFYSKQNAREAEESFRPREDAYCRFVDDIRSDNEPSRHSFGDLLLCMFDLHLRNGIHENKTRTEGFTAYGDRLNIFFAQMLLGNEALYSPENIKQHIQNFWRMEIIGAPTGFQFITSDHPSIFQSCTGPATNAANALQIIVLPLDPLNVAVAFDKRRFMWVRKATASPGDVQTINMGQVSNCRECIYATRDLDVAERQMFKMAFGKKPEVRHEMNDTGWRTAIAYLPLQYHYSFMKVKPPLF